MKKLGIPTTLGEFRKLTEQYPDETLLQFRNEPVHELIDIDGELCFQETNPFSRIKPHIGLRDHGFKAIICGIDECRLIFGPHNAAQLHSDSAELHLPRHDEWPEWELSAFEGKLNELECTEFARQFLFDFKNERIIDKQELLNSVERMNEQMTISAKNIKSFADELKVYDRENNKKKKTKGHERPYKFHR